MTSTERERKPFSSARTVLAFGCLAVLILGHWSGAEAGPRRQDAPAAKRAAALRGDHVWLAPDGTPLTIQDVAEIRQFLETAEIVSSEKIGDGINKFNRLLLRKDGVEMRAVFRDVRIFKKKTKFANGRTVLNFRDDCGFELAAYQIGKLLGIDTIPPVVSRKWKGKRGTVQLWMEETFTEKERIEKDLSPPDSQDWILQWQVIRLFDNLIYNDDRNLGNTLIDGRWRVWMIDHTRSFFLSQELKNPQIVRFCDRKIWERLKSLDQDEVEEATRGLLTGKQIRALFKRRDLLVQHLERRIREKGETSVLF